MNVWMPLSFQNMASPLSASIEYLYDYICIWLLLVLIIVSGVMWSFIVQTNVAGILSDNTILEFVWLVLPSLILIFIGVPSLLLLYSTESQFSPDISIKITAHQWYWTYDYTDFVSVEFDSYMLQMDDMSSSNMRLLDTDNHMVVPYDSSCRLLVSSADVLHSFAMPSMGVKADANPGRMNIIALPHFHTMGLFFGQCSEICGANHSFMPICMEVTSPTLFMVWTHQFCDAKQHL